ncbi:hypothetical protein O7606_20175 [Micromonospora sp. WMMD882]|uniref:hypothetical protein n=1 Tax=Micromonospora sp. WMMD882 TaxID=3015151 RepID=UPI00248B4BD8|nr:hypothetical protein [Micromonospora sp. WMMD882]WBB78523.1 hypothetical protein O7606_20175 [Micromonospora sp. WMMD882]
MGVSVAAGAVTVTGAALVVVVFGAAELPARVLVVAAVVGWFSARVGDLRAVVAVTALAVAVFVGFLANRYGDLTGGEGWSYAPLIPFAAALGAGYQRMTTYAEDRAERRARLFPRATNPVAGPSGNRSGGSDGR